MTEYSFTEADKQKFIEFLNQIAKSARFDMSTEELVAYFKLLAHMQQQILPKINANILEVVRVIEAKDKAAAEAKETPKEPKAAKSKA